nr:NAD(P)H-dependent oxidoreductase [Zongyanglinia marina]
MVASPEYVRGIPGGLKNAIDWLVSGDEIIAKPIVLAHASQRGLDMLASLRLVLGTVSQRFNAELFVQFPLMSQTPQDVRCTLETEENASVIEAFLKDFSAYIQHTDSF